MMFPVFSEVFRNASYIFTAVAVAWGVFTAAIWLPNLDLVGLVLFSDAFPLSAKLSILFSLYGSIQTNFTLLSAASIIAIAILFGVNIALLLYYVRRMQSVSGNTRRHGAANIGGLVSGILGVGCVACGSVILTSAFSLIGAGGILVFLPLRGGEFGLLGVLLLGYVTYMTARKIREPLVCNPS